MGAVGTSAAGAPAESMGATLKHEILMNTRSRTDEPTRRHSYCGHRPQAPTRSRPQPLRWQPPRPPPPNNKRQGPRAVVMEDDISSDSPGTGLTRHHSSSPRGPHLCPSDTPSPIKPLQTPSPTDFTDLLTTIDKLRRQFYARSQAFFAGILDESRRGLDTAGRYGVS